MKKIQIAALLVAITPILCCAKEINCSESLTNLIVPNFDTPMNKKDIHAELSESNNGVYSVRIFATADSPDNLDKQVSIGWVNLDTHANAAYDITQDINHPKNINLNKFKYFNYKSECLHLNNPMYVISVKRTFIYTKPNIAFKSKEFLIKGDKVDATAPIFRNWIEFSYKNGKATGWLNIADLSLLKK